jgi:hypothetical protein
MEKNKAGGRQGVWEGFGEGDSSSRDGIPVAGRSLHHWNTKMPWNSNQQDSQVMTCWVIEFRGHGMLINISLVP